MALRLAIVLGMILVPLEIAAQANQKEAARRTDSSYQDHPKSPWLSLTVLTLNSETQKNLARELKLGGRPTPDESWDSVFRSRSNRTHSALMKGLGYGQGYRYAHSDEDAADMSCLPPGLAGAKYYQPLEHGAEPELTRHTRKKD